MRTDEDTFLRTQQTVFCPRFTPSRYYEAPRSHKSHIRDLLGVSWLVKYTCKIVWAWVEILLTPFTDEY